MVSSPSIPAADLRTAAPPRPDLTWDPLPPPDQVDVNGALLWYPSPGVTVRAHRIFGDRWEVLIFAGTTTSARFVGSVDVGSLVYEAAS